jgi:hypothetical protein
MTKMSVSLGRPKETRENFKLVMVEWRFKPESISAVSIERYMMTGKFQLQGGHCFRRRLFYPSL